MPSVTRLRATPHLLGNRLDLFWENPPATDFAPGFSQSGICIMRLERTFPLSYSDHDGDRIYDGPPISHFTDDGLKPLTTYYYTVFVKDNAATPNYYESEAKSVAAFVTKHYNLAEGLYKLLPAVHQRYDTLSPVELKRQGQYPGLGAALDALPSSLRNRGQLWRFFHAAVAPLDLMRSFAEGLRSLTSAELTRPEFLPLLAQWLGWDLNHTLPVFAQRNEIKFAPHLYRSIGTIPTLRTIVTRYTGWYTQAVEFAQHIARSNMPPQLNIFAIQETPQGWQGTDDAAPVLGFGRDNCLSLPSGDETTPAMLSSNTKEPFTLRPGMEFSISADGRPPTAIRFQIGDFADISRATAQEVATVLNRTLPEITAAVEEGRVVLTSPTTGPQSSLQVEQYTVSLVTLEGAPRGRVATCMRKSGSAYIFYETADPLAQAKQHAAIQSFNGELFSWLRTRGGDQQGFAANLVTSLPSEPQGTVRYKCFRNGAWRDSFPLTSGTGEAQGDPVAVVRSDGSIWVAWIDNPYTDKASIRFMIEDTSVQSDVIRWFPPRDGPYDVKGRYADLHAVVDSTNVVHLFWAEFADSHWFIRTAHWNGMAWSSAETVAGGLNDDGLGPNREPYAVLDGENRIWLFWAHRQGGIGTSEDSWTLRRRIFDGTWGSETAVTTIPTGGRLADREPSAVLLPDDDPQKATLQVFFRSDRAGGSDLWSITISVATEALGIPLALTADPSISHVPADQAPAPLRMPDGALWLLYRSDRSISLSQVATRTLPQQESRVTSPPSSLSKRSAEPLASARMVNAGMVRRYSGSTSVVTNDIARNSRRRLLDDLLAYTPVGVSGNEVLQQDDLYTRGTVGLYISQLVPDSQLSQKQLERLRVVLEGFLPINVRVIVMLAPPVEIEYLYPDGAAIKERYLDKFPYVDYYSGLSESTAIVLPDWDLFHSNTLDDISVKPSDPATLQHRTYQEGLLPPSPGHS